MDKAKQALMREFGPLPVWAWLIVIVGGVIVGRLITKATSGGGGDAPEAAEGSPSRIQLPAGYSGGAVGGGIALPNGAAPEINSTEQAIATNDEWRSRAVAFLVGAGAPPLGVDRALFAYLNGQALSPEQADYVGEAITRFGIPPSAPAAPTAESSQPATPAEVLIPAPTVAAPVPPKQKPKDRAEAVVFEAYDDILGREPDAQGLTFWADQIRTGKTSVSQMRNAMADSVEFGQAIATGA